jgi:hypothetical protein
MSRIMRSELERLAGVAVGHGRDDPALDVFLTFVGTLDPLPNAETLQPAALKIGKLRLAQALDRPGEPRLGACRLLAAASAHLQRPVAPPLDRVLADRSRQHATAGGGPEPFRSVGVVDSPGGRTLGTVTVERPPATGHRIPELFEALLHAVRTGLSLFA